MPTLKIKQISSLKQYISFVESLPRSGGSKFWYRGCGRIKHTLKPSLYRHRFCRSIDDFMALEKNLLARFQQRSIPFHSQRMTNNWEWLFLMQHYGVPTRLLDWSESPLMALFFAVTSARHVLGARGQPVFENDAAVWVLNPVQWNKRSVNLKSFVAQVLTSDASNASAYAPVGDPNVMKPFPISLYGAHNSQRIVAQRGVFVCFGADTRPMEKIFSEETFPDGCLTKLVIRRSRLPGVYSALLRHGFTDSVVFPDLDGLAREIKREYGFEI